MNTYFVEFTVESFDSGYAGTPGNLYLSKQTQGWIGGVKIGDRIKLEILDNYGTYMKIWKNDILKYDYEKEHARYEKINNERIEERKRFHRGQS